MPIMPDMPRQSSPRPPGSKRRALYGALAAGLVGLLLSPGLRGVGNAASAYDWPQFDGDAAHSGNNTAESTLTASNVGGLTRLFRATLPSFADGAPAYLSAVATASGTRDLLYATTRAGDLVALDAHTGAQVWVAHNPAPGGCGINGGSTPCYTTSSPAVDPNRQYVYSYGLDGYAHKYSVGDGTEIKSGGWPELTTTKGFDEKGSSALTVATAGNGASYLYVAHGGYPGDNGDYQGHVTSINLGDGSQHVYNANCSNLTIHFVENGATSGAGQNDCAKRQTAIWAREGVVYDRDTDKIYMTTGNGTFDAANNPPGNDWGDTIFALHPDGTGTGVNGNPLDSYTPGNYQSLQNGDTDIGSTAPAILPVPASSSVRHLAVQSGKDSKLRLLNLDNLSSQGGPRHLGGEVGAVINVPQGNEVLTAPAVWVDPQGNTWVFVANYNGISGLQLTVAGDGTPGLRTMWTNSSGNRTSPIVAGGVLYDAGGNLVEALDPTTGHQLWHDTTIGGIHWESPIVANGVLYITDNNGALTAYALPAAAGNTSTPTARPSATRTTAPATSTATRTAMATATQITSPPATATTTSTSAPPSATSTSAPPSATPSPTHSAPTSTPTPPTPMPMATATSTGVAATATSAPPTATGTGTATATATTTSTATPTTTSTATGTATATATGTPTTSTATPRTTCARKPSLDLRVPRGIVTGNGTVEVHVRTEPRTAISVTLELTQSTVESVMPTTSASRHKVQHGVARPRRVTKTVVLYRTTVTVRTGGAGDVTARIHIAYSPRRTTRATLTVMAHTPCGKPGRSIHVVVVPAPMHKHAAPKSHPAKGGSRH